MDIEQAYKVIGVKYGCSDLNYIKKKYRQLMKVYHPDAGGNNFKAVCINEAYSLLKKSVKQQLIIDEIDRVTNAVKKDEVHHIEFEEYIRKLKNGDLQLFESNMLIHFYISVYSCEHEAICTKDSYIKANNKREYELYLKLNDIEVDKITIDICNGIYVRNLTVIGNRCAFKFDMDKLVYMTIHIER